MNIACPNGRHVTRQNNKEKGVLTLVIPLDLGVGSHDGAKETRLSLVALEARLGSDGSHGEE